MALTIISALFRSIVVSPTSRCFLICSHEIIQSEAHTLSPQATHHMWKSVTSVAFRTFSLTLLHQHLSILSVPFRTINLVLFAQVIITHPVTCWEGLMTAAADRQNHVTSRHEGWLLNVVTIGFQASPSYSFPRILSLWESFPFCWTCSSVKTLKQTTPIVSLSYSLSRLSFRCWTFLP